MNDIFAIFAGGNLEVAEATLQELPQASRAVCVEGLQASKVGRGYPAEPKVACPEYDASALPSAASVE